MCVLRTLAAALCFAAAPSFAETEKPRHPAFYPVLKANYTYAIPTGLGTLTISMSVPSVLPVDVEDGHSPIAQPVFTTFTLAPEKTRAALELDIPLRAADPVAERFADPFAGRFFEQFARSIMAVSVCKGGEIGVQSAAGRYRLSVAERERLKSTKRAYKAGQMPPSRKVLGQNATAQALPVRKETRGASFIVWKADMTCSFWRNPAAQRQLARMHEGLEPRERDPLRKIRAERLWETDKNHSFGKLPTKPAQRPGPRWADPNAVGIYVATIPGVPRAPGLLRARPRPVGR